MKSTLNFINEDDIQKNSNPTEAVVTIQGANNILSKHQIAFNKLTEEIRKMTFSIEKMEDLLQKLLAEFGKKIGPVNEQLMRQQIDFIKAMYGALQRSNFSKLQQGYLTNYMVDVLNKCFSEVEPTDDDIEIYNKVNKTNYHDDLKEEQEEDMQNLADELYERFGLKVDPSEIGSDPEKLASLSEKLKAHLEAEALNNNKKDQYDEAQKAKKVEKKKSKKQLATEAKLKEEENVKLKSIRSVYLTLVKLLHPDTEADEKVKYEKEEVMKRVTVAYEAKDLATLLKIELQWVANASDNLQNLTDEKLKLYNNALREQIRELRIQKYEIERNPKYQHVVEYKANTLKKGAEHIAYKAKHLQVIVDGLKQSVIDLQGKGAKEILKHIAKEQKNKEEQFDPFDFFDGGW